jgi:thiol-disulfide isomerase/thioredoxin
MPEFSFTSLDDSYKTLTNDTFKGKCYLVEFWATWCVPCVDEMENLHKVYEKYRKMGFEILSLSFDAVPEDVQSFRAKKWRMPWQHGFIGKDEFRVGSSSSDYFEVQEIPKAVLVDRTGRIVAAGTDLVGDKLRKELVKLMGN